MTIMPVLSVATLQIVSRNKDMMKNLNTFVTLGLAISLAACSAEETTKIPVNDWPWGATQEVAPSEPETPVDSDQILEAGWTNVGNSYGDLPAHISVYRSPSKLQGKAAIAYIAVADMSAADWDVWSVADVEMDGTEDSYRTPSDVYEEGGWPIITNAGYFYYSGKNYTSSLAVSSGELLAYNINYASQDWVTIYNPTRGAFLETKDETFDACWSYYTGTEHYIYQIPADNSYGEEPKPTPSASFPEDAAVFEAETAIGGGPVLINGGQFANTWSEEMFDYGGVDPTGNHPRTAIGVTADGQLILFVCEGRNQTEGVAGLTTEDVANVLLDLGCVEAMNLDGGGSSCMLVNGKETIKVSDGSQRSVASTVMFK